MPDFGFVGESYTARSLYQDSQELINWYPEIDPVRGEDRRGVIALYPTPGKATVLTLPDLAEVRAMMPLAGSTVLLTVCGASVYSINPGLVATKVGTLATSQGPVSIADDGVWAMLADGTNRYAYNTSNGVFSAMSPVIFTGSISATTLTVTAITSGIVGPFQSISGAGITPGTSITAGTPLGPGQTGTFTVSPSQGPLGPVTITGIDGGFVPSSYVAEVDTFFVYVQPGTINFGVSSSNSPVSPNVPPAISQKDGSSDLLVSMVVNNRELFLLGERSTEVWVDQGTFPVPFARLPGTSTQRGCVAPYSVARLGPSFAWLGRDNRGQNIVFAMNGYAPERISTYAVEDQLNKYIVTADARAYSYQQGGHEFYVLNFPSADVTWVYDSTTRMWHKRAYRDALNVLHRDRGNCAAIFANQVLVGDWQNGNIYALSYNVFTDIGGAYIYRQRKCPHLTKDLKRVFHHELQIQFEPGAGITGVIPGGPIAPSIIQRVTFTDGGLGVPNGGQSVTVNGVTAGNMLMAVWFVQINPEAPHAMTVHDNTQGVNFTNATAGGGSISNPFFARIDILTNANGGSHTILVDTLGGNPNFDFDLSGVIYEIAGANPAVDSTATPWNGSGASGTVFTGSVAPTAANDLVILGTTSSTGANQPTFSAPITDTADGGSFGTIGNYVDPAVGMLSIPATIQTPGASHSSAVAVALSGSGSSIGGPVQGTNPMAMLQWSDDGGSTYSGEHWVPIGLIGQYKFRAIWRKLGYARDRIYLLSVSDPIKWVVISAELKTTEGIH